MTMHELTGPTDLPTGEIASLRAHLRREMARRIEQKLLPYEGRWVTREEVEANLRHARKRAWVHAFELLVLCAALVGLSLLILEFLKWLAG